MGRGDARWYVVTSPRLEIAFLMFPRGVVFEYCCSVRCVSRFAVALLVLRWGLQSRSLMLFVFLFGFPYFCSLFFFFITFLSIVVMASRTLPPSLPLSVGGVGAVKM